MSKIFLITGGAGFIGSALIRHIIDHTSDKVLNIDKLTYAGNLDSLKSIESSERYKFEKVDICDPKKLKYIFDKYTPDIVIHLAAESHVDRSIDSPSDFIHSNILGTYNLLEQAKSFWTKLNKAKKNSFRFHHVSTDEVYGDLEGSEGLFTEETSYSPSSPYSASKASSDHLVRAWHRTYGVPIIITNCSNNYGPYQFPEKLIPHVIISALNGKPLPIYGKGNQIRDWLYVDDHVRALVLVANEGKVGETYNIGGHNEKQNIEVVHAICNLLDELIIKEPRNIEHFSQLIEFVKDRPGHDTRYAIDATKIYNDLGWRPQEDFESGIKKAIHFYLNNYQWWERVISGEYMLKRLGNKL